MPNHKTRSAPAQFNYKKNVWFNDGLTNRFERRAHERYPLKMQARFFYGNRVYGGLVTDISERGMFICTDMRFPKSYMMDIMLLINNEVLKVPVKIRRNVKPDTGADSGVGVELVGTPDNYLDFVNCSKLTDQL